MIFVVCILFKFVETSPTREDIKISIDPLICNQEDEINLKDTCSTTTDIFNELNCINVVNTLRSAILEDFTGFKVVETLEGILIFMIILII